MLFVPPESSSQWRVSCTIDSPFSNAFVWRAISKTSARSSERMEFMFLISTFVPNAVSPAGRSDTLASQRSDPSSMRTSLTSRDAKVARSSRR